MGWLYLLCCLRTLPVPADDSPVILLCAVFLARDGKFVPHLV